MFMPPKIEDWLPDDHLAKFVADIVDQLDISCISRQYGRRGAKAYHPRIMICLLFYGYAEGIFSSRKLEKATYLRVDFRYITGDLHPDHDTINEFRRRFLKELGSLFAQILMIAQEMGILKMANIAIDGTKIKANASKHKAVSYKRAREMEKKIEAQVAELLRQAEAADHEPVDEEKVNFPEEIARREARLKKLCQAQAVIETRARERYEQEKAEYEAKQAQREKKAQETGRKPKGPPLKPPEPGPRDKDQYNFTDPESRIMKDGASGGFEQAYNAQASVDTESMLIVGQHITDQPNDKEQLIPSLEAIPAELDTPKTAVADNGYYSQDNVTACKKHKVDPYLATGRTKHSKSLDEKLNELRGVEPPPLPENATVKEKMAHKLRTVAGRALYRLRKMTVEPVFGIIKEILNFRRFSLRGLEKVSGEWALVSIGYNLKRMFALK